MDDLDTLDKTEGMSSDAKDGQLLALTPNQLSDR